jgi:hypothetical protein
MLRNPAPDRGSRGKDLYPVRSACGRESQPMRRFFLIARLPAVLLGVIAGRRLVISPERLVCHFLHQWHGARATRKGVDR